MMGRLPLVCDGKSGRIVENTCGFDRDAAMCCFAFPTSWIGAKRSDEPYSSGARSQQAEIANSDRDNASYWDGEI